MEITIYLSNDEGLSFERYDRQIIEYPIPNSDEWQF